MIGCNAVRIRLHCLQQAARHTTADRVAAHRKSDQSRDGLCVAELRKRVLSRYAVVNSGVLTR